MLQEEKILATDRPAGLSCASSWCVASAPFQRRFCNHTGHKKVGMQLPCQLEGSQLKGIAFSWRGIPLSAWHSSSELRGLTSSLPQGQSLPVFANVDDEDYIGNSLLQIWELRIVHKAKLLFRL